MAVSQKSVEDALQSAIQNLSFLRVEDVSGSCDGSKFDLIVVSDVFTGKSLLDRQRLVNDALKPFMSHIHAVTMKTWTPEQYEQRKDSIK
eukprot:TRINITY_DN12134_c0_g1_i1.p1 TRINITY_DN12134_c0_g1~~TRINITY_DN12134_c0_g1_i1.p1  ORF type:complete len:101 (+),score=16.36 TRINITY_DN12134_c0_g1_i1:34-303(+)